MSLKKWTAIRTLDAVVRGSVILGSVFALEQALLQPVCAQEVQQEKYTPKYETIGHRFLYFETGIGFKDHHYKILDDIIDGVIKRIEVKPSYDKKEAFEILKVINDFLIEKKFKYKKNYLLSEGIEKRKVDCDNLSIIYLSIADVIGLPLFAIKPSPQHVAVRCYIDGIRYFNWEPTSGKTVSDDKYKKIFGLSEEEIEAGIYLRSLSRQETMSIIFCNAGLSLCEDNKVDWAIRYFHEATKLNPTYSLAFYNKARVLLKRYKEKHNQEDLDELLRCFRIALELEPAFKQNVEEKLKEHFGDKITVASLFSSK